MKMALADIDHVTAIDTQMQLDNGAWKSIILIGTDLVLGDAEPGFDKAARDKLLQDIQAVQRANPHLKDIRLSHKPGHWLNGKK
jgi:hypothetical protein